MNLLVALAAGLLLGVFFYAGLWFTIRALTRIRYPLLLTLSSFWVRTAVTLAGFLLAARGAWFNAAVCLAGFVLGRIVVTVLLPASVPAPGGRPPCT